MIRIHTTYEFLTGGVRLDVGIPVSPTQYKVLMADGSWEIVSHESAPPEGHGLPLPAGVWEAIREYIHPLPATAGEIARLEDALRLERARVDRLLADLVGLANPGFDIERRLHPIPPMVP